MSNERIKEVAKLVEEAVRRKDSGFPNMEATVIRAIESIVEFQRADPPLTRQLVRDAVRTIPAGYKCGGTDNELIAETIFIKLSEPQKWYPCDDDHIAEECSCIYLSRPNPSCYDEIFHPTYGSGRKWGENCRGYRWTYRHVPNPPPTEDESPCVKEVREFIGSPKYYHGNHQSNADAIAEIVKRHESKGVK